MIESKDVRRGNLILLAEDNEISIVNKIDGTGLEVLIDGTPIWIELDAFEGVKLTSEWLKRCGFYKASISQPYDYFDGKTGYIFLVEKDGYFKLWINNGTFGEQFNTVHHFMNIYHSLTQKELEIK